MKSLKLKKIVIALSAISVLSIAAAPARADGEFKMGFGVLGAAVGVPLAAVFIPWGAWEYFHPAKVDPTLAFDPMDAKDVTIDHQKQLATLLNNYAQKHCTETGGQPMRWASFNTRDYAYSLDHAQAAARQETNDAALTNIPGSGQRVEANTVDGLGVHSRMQAVQAGKAHIGLTCVKDDAAGGGQVTIHHGYDPIEVWVEKFDGKVHIRTLNPVYNGSGYSRTAIVGWDAIEKAAAGADKQNQKLDF